MQIKFDYKRKKRYQRQQTTTKQSQNVISKFYLGFALYAAVTSGVEGEGGVTQLPHSSAGLT